MNDAAKIYQLYVENAAANEQSHMHVNEFGGKEWRLRGELHRIDGPAAEWLNGTKMWYQHNKLHREDGPAIENANGNKQWYLQDAHYEDAAAWAQALLKMRNKPHDEEAVQKFVRMILTKDDLI